MANTGRSRDITIAVFEGIEAAADLPELTAGEVLVSPRVFLNAEREKRYHTERDCRHLRQGNEIHLVDKAAVSELELCQQCWKNRLPELNEGEVWTRRGEKRAQIAAYHSDRNCYRLQDIDRPKVMTKADARDGGIAKCQYCDGQVAFEDRPRLVDLLRANPDMHYDDVVHQWRQRREWSPNQEATDE